MRKKLLTDAAVAAGAVKAAVIGTAGVALSASFRDICKTNACGLYGKCWMCPPDIGEIDALMNEVRSFKYALLYQTIGRLEDSFDIEGMEAAARGHMTASQSIQGAVRPIVKGGLLHLSSGGCHYCETCAKKDGSPCRFPDKAMPSMEGCGIDVYNTVKNTDLKYINGQNTVTYFGAVLFSEE